MTPCVDSKCHRVCIQNVSVYAGTTRTYVSTCARVAGINGDVLSLHTGVFPRSKPPHTQPHQPHTPHTEHTLHTPHTRPRTPHNHTQRDTPQRKKTEKEDREREEKTKETMKNNMKEKKTEIMMWIDAESKLAQGKAKLAN